MMAGNTGRSTSSTSSAANAWPCMPLRRFRSNDVIDVLADLFIEHGPPKHIRSDNGPEFVVKAVREWLGRLGATTFYIEPGSPWENGYIESFHARLRDELLDGEIFYSLEEVRIGADRITRQTNLLLPFKNVVVFCSGVPLRC